MARSKPVSTGNPSTTTVTEDTQEVNNETLRLKLKKAGEKKKIQWTEDTVDNEGDCYWDLEFGTNHSLQVWARRKAKYAASTRSRGRTSMRALTMKVTTVRVTLTRSKSCVLLQLSSTSLSAL